MELLKFNSCPMNSLKYLWDITLEQGNKRELSLNRLNMQGKKCWQWNKTTESKVKGFEEQSTRIQEVGWGRYSRSLNKRKE